MYYDRRVADELARALREGGPLRWLIDHIADPLGRAHHAHIALRRAAGERRLGSVQLYWGRTSPLEFQARRGERVRLKAHASYRALSPALFERAYSMDELGALTGALVWHLRRASSLLKGEESRRAALVEGEAVCHAGLMYRYGHGFQEGDQLLALDAEAKVGYPSRDAQRRADGALFSALGLGADEALPKKLDTLGLSPSGDILLIEVKDEAGDIRRAVTQAAAHVWRFSALKDAGLSEVLAGMLGQKRDAGLIPQQGPRLGGAPQIIPWVAAPDGRADWSERWSEESVDLRQKWSGLLDGLRWVRLTDRGDVIEIKTP